METGLQYVNRLFAETESLLKKVGILSRVADRSSSEVADELEDARADLRKTLGKIFAQVYGDFCSEWEASIPSDSRLSEIDAALFALVDYLYES